MSETTAWYTIYNVYIGSGVRIFNEATLGSVAAHIECRGPALLRAASVPSALLLTMLRRNQRGAVAGGGLFPFPLIYIPVA
jgi:hypothetical protein